MKKYLPFFLLFLLFITTIGAIWDIWSHNANILETFWTPSHALIYFSVAGVGFTILGVVIYESVKLGRFSPAEIPNVKGLALAGSGSVFQLLAGVSDDIYHNIFGFDVTMWSPPHVAVIFGAFVTVLGVFELRDEKSEIRHFISSILAISMGIVFYFFSTLEYEMNFQHYTLTMEDKNWDLIHRWQPYGAYLSIMIIPVLTYGITLATKKFNFAVGTIVTSIVFFIKYLMFLWYNGTILDMYFPLLLPLCGIVFDLLYLKCKNWAYRFYAANIGMGVTLIALTEIQNPLPTTWNSLLISLIGVLILSIAFTRLALNGISLKGYHHVIALFLIVLSVPTLAFAHEKTETIVPVEKIAPDLHPLWILLEFFIILYAGYKLAHLLATINRPKKD